MGLLEIIADVTGGELKRGSKPGKAIITLPKDYQMEEDGLTEKGLCIGCHATSKEDCIGCHWRED